MWKILPAASYRQMTCRFILALLLTGTFFANAQNKQLTITGRVLTLTGKAPVHNALVQLSSTAFSTYSDSTGLFVLKVPYKPVVKLLCRHLAFDAKTAELRASDTALSIETTIYLAAKPMSLDTVGITAVQKPETLVGKPDYSVFDFDFYEDKLLLLTSKGSLKNARVQLSDYDGKIHSTCQLPTDAGEARYFFRDYEGYTSIVCNDTIFRLDVLGQNILMMTVRKSDFERYLKPVADTANGHYYFSNYWEKFPQFNYYTMQAGDSVAKLLAAISNSDLLKLYNMEYYYLPSGAQLEARRIADAYNADVHVVAALMSGFTNSMFYEPLYAPLFVINDTVCIFNHHNDFLYHFTKNNVLIDSVKISYHHPKNWREWKKKLFLDESQNKVYAFFSKDGHNYLKQIHHITGREVKSYKLQHHSAEKIKIKDGYVYYVYRPFGSTQEKFLYRERIP